MREYRIRRSSVFQKNARPSHGGIVAPEAWGSYWWVMEQAGDAGGRRPSASFSGYERQFLSI